MSIQTQDTTQRLLVPAEQADINWHYKTMELLSLNRQEEALKDDRRSLAKSMKTVVGARNKLLDEMQAQSVYKDVPCREVLNFADETVPYDELGVAVPARHCVVVRLDTGEIVEAWPLTSDDMQKEMFDDGECESDRADDYQEQPAESL